MVLYNCWSIGDGSQEICHVLARPVCHGVSIFMRRRSCVYQDTKFDFMKPVFIKRNWNIWT